MSSRYSYLAAIAFAVSAPLSAQTVKSGIEAWQRADYKGAVAIWRPLAIGGDADAQFNLGQAFRLGRGVELSLPAAKSWFERAAQTGHLDAQTTLGLLLFQNGEHPEGLRWLKKAAEQDEPRALLVYGTALYNGDGITQDRPLGYAYVSRAASLRLAPAKETLAQLETLMPAADRQKAVLLADARAKAMRSAAKSAKAERPVRVVQTKAPPPRAEPKRVAVATKTPPRPVALPAHGAWRIQLGAFSQRAQAQARYQQLSGKAVLAGRSAAYIPNGAIIRLQVGPFESKAAAAAACRAVASACFPVPPAG